MRTRDPTAHQSLSLTDVSFFYATVTIDEVLSGTPDTRTPGTVELRLDLTGSLEEVAATMPEHEHLLLLRNGGQDAEERGKPPDVQEQWRYAYIPAGTGGVLRDIDGVTRTLGGGSLDLFPAGLDGDPFDAVVQRVRQSLD